MFDFATAGRIVFGRGVLKEAAGIAKNFGHRAFVVTGKNSQRAAPLLELLRKAGVSATPFAIEGEPTTGGVIQGTQEVKKCAAEMVISFGGGSVIDAGKAIAALATNSGDLFDYLEVIGKAKCLEQAPLPFIAIPTTAGTGAEVTRNAVLASKAHRVKVSLRSL
jgi:alcohol dehydrogenase class IV